MTFRPVQDRIEYGGALIGDEEINAINTVIRSQGGRRWTIGPESVAFEKELAETTGVKHAVVTNSGSSALLVALGALKLPKGSKVIIPACNFPTAFNAIIQNGYEPVVVDIDSSTLNLSLIETKIAMRFYPDIKAVIAVHIAGNPVDIEELRGIVGEKVKIVVDNCDGYGSTLRGKMVEQYADVSCVSFHAAHIITTGEGGAVLTDDDEIGARAMKMREWGRASGTDKIYEYPGFPDDYKERYVYEEIGYNMKPLELQCAMGRIQLKKLNDFKTARRLRYNQLKGKFMGLQSFQMVKETDQADTCWFSFPLYCMDRKRAMEIFEKNNIETRTIFSGNILKHPAYKDVKVYRVGDLLGSDGVMARGMFLSCHPSLTPEMIDFIGEVARKI